MFNEGFNIDPLVAIGTSCIHAHKNDEVVNGFQSECKIPLIFRRVASLLRLFVVCWRFCHPQNLLEYEL